MLLKENSHKITKQKYKSGSGCTTYYFYCSRCNDEIRVQSMKSHSGLCRRCTQKKAPYEHIIGELKKTCNNRNRECSLTLEQFVKLLELPYCHYCDTQLHFNPHTRDNDGNHISRANQLDRKNNTIGYHINNLVLCCWECNRLKSNRFTYEEFLQLKPILTKIMKDRKVLELEDDTLFTQMPACSGNSCEI